MAEDEQKPKTQSPRRPDSNIIPTQDSSVSRRDTTQETIDDVKKIQNKHNSVKNDQSQKPDLENIKFKTLKDSSDLDDEKKLTEIEQEEEKLTLEEFGSISTSIIDSPFMDVEDSDDRENNGDIISSGEINEDDLDDKEKNNEEFIFKQSSTDDDRPIMDRTVLRAKNKKLAAIKNFDLKNKLKNIESSLIDVADDDKTYVKQWANFGSADNFLNARRLSRVPCTVSGYMAEMSALSHMEILALNRTTGGRDTPFFRRKIIRYQTVFDHIRYTSLDHKSIRDDFETWAKATKLADTNSLFFGLYDATFPGLNQYNLVCSKCRKQFMVEKNNNDIICYNRSTKKERYDAILKNSEMKAEDSVFDAMTSKKVLDNGIYVVQKLPSVWDYLQTIKELSDIKGINTAAIEMSNTPEWFSLFIMTFVHTLGLPILQENTTVDKKTGKEVLSHTLSYAKKSSKEDIVNILIQLDTQDFTKLMMGKKLYDILMVKGTEYALQDVECTNSECRAQIPFADLSMEDIFFSMINQKIYQMNAT